VSEQKVSSPDGRTWSVKISRSRRGFRESPQAPYLIAHLIVTTIMVVVFFVIVKSGVFQIISILIAIVFVVWLVGFLNGLFRVTISADTVGPPPDHRLWVVLKRRGLQKRVSELVEAISRGQDSREPEGTRLVEI
jgi:hypothetical protein